MSKNIIILIFAVLFFAVSCKKDSGAAVNTPTLRTLDFKASSSDTLQISLTIIRPTGLQTGVTGEQIAGFGSNQVVNPYEYKSGKIQPGDNVYIQVQTTPGKPLNSTLTVDGKSIQSTSTISNPVHSGLTWNIYVK